MLRPPVHALPTEPTSPPDKTRQEPSQMIIVQPLYLPFHTNRRGQTVQCSKAALHTLVHNSITAMLTVTTSTVNSFFSTTSQLPRYLPLE